MSIPSVDFAQRLYAVLAPHLPDFPYPASVKPPAGATARAPHSLNSNIRVYKYTSGQHFGPHYDDSVRDTATGAKSEWTLLIYLTGAQDGVQGGEVSADSPDGYHRDSPCTNIVASTDTLLQGTTRKARRDHSATTHSRYRTTAPVCMLPTMQGRFS